jgi:enoyl-CoA hydratase
MPLAIPSTILYEQRDHIATITINREDAMNSLTLEMLLGIEEAFDDFNADDDAWVAILTAAGDKAFSSGLDLKEAAPMLTGGDEMGFADHTKRQFSDVFKPIICAVNGFCIAGGMEMLLGTDIRIAAEHATFGLGEVKWGLIPLGGTHIRLPKQIPWAIAMQLLLTGKNIDAQRAYEVGIVNEVVPAEELMPTARKLAERMCRNGPLAMKTAKEIAVRSLELEPGFVLEKALGARVLRSDDAKEGPLAFSEKRPAKFTGK